ncbi:hypothetical protein PVAP13_7KG383501 [Panicum virgatum]|uniref:Uncharacterized protein n=1 Tax=Panicum virgatum TaxID=38727 RepID=A0A8T0QQY1_PANVG|nr:hypothetical protein PVAP13_7KG383501 [Panicum virgatum]
MWGYGLWEWRSFDRARLTASVGPPLMICLRWCLPLLHWPVPPASLWPVRGLNWAGKVAGKTLHRRAAAPRSPPTTPPPPAAAPPAASLPALSSTRRRRRPQLHPPPCAAAARGPTRPHARRRSMPAAPPAAATLITPAHRHRPQPAHRRHPPSAVPLGRVSSAASAWGTASSARRRHGGAALGRWGTGGMGQGRAFIEAACRCRHLRRAGTAACDAIPITSPEIGDPSTGRPLFPLTPPHLASEPWIHHEFGRRGLDPPSDPSLLFGRTPSTVGRFWPHLWRIIARSLAHLC